jgi:hypothetical protein
MRLICSPMLSSKPHRYFVAQPSVFVCPIVYYRLKQKTQLGCCHLQICTIAEKSKRERDAIEAPDALNATKKRRSEDKSSEGTELVTLL